MKLKIIYSIHRIYYTGDNVGSDWTFYISTMAGVFKLNSSIKQGETEYDFKTIAIVEQEEGQNLIDTWWISATERDRTVDDQGVSARFRVPYTVELGAEHVRTLTFEVPEKEHSNKRARLSFQFGIFIDEATAPMPTVDATLVPKESTIDIELPTRVAGEFPSSFKGTAYARDRSEVPVVAQKMVELFLGDRPNNPRDQILIKFLETFVNDNLPTDFTPKLALYRIASPSGQLFWSSQNSSAGYQTQGSLIEALNEAATPEGGREPSFERLPRQLLPTLLSTQLAGDLGEAAQTLADVIMVLTELRPEQTPMYQDYFIRRVDLGYYSGVWTRAFYVEPTPYAGPDQDLWLIVYSDGWEVEPELP